MKRDKVCPHCAAKLDANANFCLYCMTSLDQKTVIRAKRVRLSRRVLVPLGAVMLAAVIAVAANGWDDTVPTQGGSNKANGTQSHNNLSVQDTALQGDNAVGSSAPQRPASSDFISRTSSAVSVASGSSSRPATSSNASTHAASVNSSKPAASSQNGGTAAASSRPSSSSAATSSEWEFDLQDMQSLWLPKYEGGYYVRTLNSWEWDTARYGTQPQNAVAFLCEFSGGQSLVPSSLEGHPVVAISSAFFGAEDSWCPFGGCERVTAVTLPSSIVFVDDDVLHDCRFIKHLYITGDTFYMNPIALRDTPSDLVIHASATCSFVDENGKKVYWKDVCQSKYKRSFQLYEGGKVSTGKVTLQ